MVEGFLLLSRRLRAATDELAAYRVRRGQPEPSLFDTIQAVTEAAGEVWRLEALEAIVTIAKRKPVLTVEDVSPLCPPTIDMRALGGVMLDAQRRATSPRAGGLPAAERHGRPVREWHSRIYRAGGSAV